MNLDKAVTLVRSSGWRTKLADSAASADRRVLAADTTTVVRTDSWQYTAPPLTVGGSDSHSFTTQVGSTVDRLRVSLVHPSGGTVGANLFSYTVTVSDPGGKTVATSTESPTAGSGTATALVNLRKLGLAPGTYTFAVTGDYAASDPDTIDSDSALGRVVLLHVAQVRKG